MKQANTRVKLEAVFVKTQNGTEPVREWLKSLPKIDRLVIGADIKTVQYGWPLGMPLVRHLGHGLWEIRSKLIKRGIARTIFFMDADLIVLVNGFIKKTQKTPKQELELAYKRKYQYLESKC